MRFCASLRDSTCGIVAIHNFTRFKDFIAVINLAQYYRLPRVINHARNDNKPPIASLRGANVMSNEAIHNIAKSKFCNGIFKGEIKDYRLPRLRTKSRNDCDSRIINMLDDSLPQPLTRLRNDNKPPTASLRGANEMSNEAIHNLAKSKFCNGIFKGEIKDYRLPRVINHARNDAVESVDCQDSTIPQVEFCNDRVCIKIEIC